MEECWWIDESHPGPQPFDWNQYYHSVELAGRQYGKTFALISKRTAAALAPVGVTMQEMIEALKPMIAIYDEVAKLQAPKPAPRTGPQSNPFAKRGKTRRK